MSLTGAWEVVDFKEAEMPEEVKEAYDEAFDSLLGCDYVCGLYAARQVVDGMKYAFICRATAIYPGAVAKLVKVIIYKRFDEKAIIDTIEEIKF